MGVKMSLFQSAPAHVSGRYLQVDNVEVMYSEFQSAPAHVSGRYDAGWQQKALAKGFNPRPLT